MEPDFSGWATKANLKCTDGRTIMPDAFAHQDKVKVPLVWSHGHDDVENVLGYAVLEHREGEGVYTYGYFNETPKGQAAKLIVEHGDLDSMSIWANELREKLTGQNLREVLHGAIKEVSLVIAGANAGAKIDFVRIAHGDGTEIETLADTAIITTGMTLEHVAGAPADEGEKRTFKEIYEGMDDDEKEVVAHMLAEALASSEGEGEGGNNSAVEHGEQLNHSETNNEGTLTHQEGNNMNRNLFENNGKGVEGGGGELVTGASLSHDQLKTIVDDVQVHGKYDTFKESLLAHAGEYGITNIELLFPEARMIDNKPEWITRRMEWVTTVLNGVRKLPYSRIKSMSADLTHEEARAKGYIKGDLKENQFFSLAGRETTPQTIYKKQQLDRDDIVDITELDVVNWIWSEMRFMLNEEIARAILVGDNRPVVIDGQRNKDKIKEENIRPIALDDPFYTDVVALPANITPSAMVEQVVRSREAYLGAGDPTAFMTRKVLNDMLLQKDAMRRRLYRNRAELAAELEVSSIVDVPAMEGVTRDEGEILMVLVDLSDYAVGTTRGGEISTFDDFDINYNQYQYLIEGRMSGALTKHKTAQVFVRDAGNLIGDGADEDVLPGPDAPSFNNNTGVVTIPAQTGVVYKDADTGVTLSSGAQNAIAVGSELTVQAEAAEGYYLPHNVQTTWTYARTA